MLNGEMVMQHDERLARRLKLRDLHTLQAVVRHGSMAKAASSLAITQSAISKTVAEMEHVLGVPLLDRTTRGVEVTAYGEILLRRGLVVFDEIRQGVREIGFLADPTTGRVRIGSTEPMLVIVAAAIDLLSRRHPRIAFEVSASDTTTLLRLMREREVDLIVSRMADTVVDDDLEADILFHDPLVVVAGKGNTWSGRRNVALGDLRGERWILPPPHTFLRPYIEGAFRACGLDLPAATVITASTHLRNNLMARAGFLTMLPRAMVRLSGWHPVVRALRVDLPTTRRPVGVLTLKRRSRSPVVQLFIDGVRQVAKPLSSDR
jgi:DNA-binding transcriptional LysR family regulator